METRSATFYSNGKHEEVCEVSVKLSHSKRLKIVLSLIIVGIFIIPAVICALPPYPPY
jgi:hypothetical protein